MTPSEIVLLVVGGFTAGVVNAMAGGGSVVTVPLLVMAGVPGNAANGSNRIAVLASSVASAVEFRRRGVEGAAHVARVLPPVLVGVVVGVALVGRLSDAAFERAFALVMVPVLLATFLSPRWVERSGEAWSPVRSAAVFFAVGVYGGAFQAGVGLVLVAALSRSGLGLVEANFVKVVVIAAYTAVAFPVFLARGQVVWGPALLLAVVIAAGGAVGARLAVVGGERVIRPIMVVAVLVLGARLLGVW